jgi:hypothetical protein
MAACLGSLTTVKLIPSSTALTTVPASKNATRNHIVQARIWCGMYEVIGSVLLLGGPKTCHKKRRRLEQWSKHHWKRFTIQNVDWPGGPFRRQCGRGLLSLVLVGCFCPFLWVAFCIESGPLTSFMQNRRRARTELRVGLQNYVVDGTPILHLLQ